MNSEPIHHKHIRKRINQDLEPYPHPNKLKRFIDKGIYIGGFFGPIMTIPQILKIWVDKHAEGVSLISWLAYMVMAIFFILYGIVHKEKPIIIIYIAWIIAEIFIISGILIYG